MNKNKSPLSNIDIGNDASVIKVKSGCEIVQSVDVISAIVDDPYELSKNKLCSWTEVECLGACVNAPIMQINQDYFEDLDEKNTEEIIKTLLEDKLPKPGSAKSRKSTAPEKGKTTLLEVKNA